MVWTILLLLGGLVALIYGADAAVDGGRRIARSFGLSELLIGLTITSIGTSLPELATSASAAVASGGEAGMDAAGVALGNILGSNLFMLSFLLGVTGLVSPLTVERRSVVRDGAAIGLGMVLLLVFALTGREVGRLEGLGMVAVYVVYLGITIRQERAAAKPATPPPPPTRREVEGRPGPTLAPTDLSEEIAEALGEDEADGGDEADVAEEAAETVEPTEESTDWRMDVGKLAAGIVVVLVGANLVVSSGVEIATAVGLSGTLIGVLVGVGTSLPEVVVSVQASWRGASDISVGNMLGSSVTNLLLCFGAAAVAHPLPVPELGLGFDWVFTSVVTGIALLLMYEQRDLTRAEGGALVLLFGLYLYLRIAVL